MRDAYYGGFFYSGMTHQGVFEVDGADPFAAGLHKILGAVDNFDEAFVVQRGYVAGFEPAVVGPAVGLVGRIVVAGGDPGAAHLELAGSFSVPRRFDVFSFRAVGTSDAQLDERRGPALFAANFVLIVFGPFAHVALEPTDRSHRRRFRHAPKVHDLEVMLIEGAHEADGRRGASDHETHGRSKFPSAGIFFEGGENAKPNGGHATSDGDLLLLDEIEHAFCIDTRSRQD